MRMNKETPTIILCLLCALGLATAAEQPGASAVREKIIQIMNENPMVPFLSEAGATFCKVFYDDFKAQKDIEYVQPIVVTNDYSSKELQDHTNQCPNLVLNKNLELEVKIADSLRNDKVPEAEWDKYGTVYYGVSNFKLFKVDINNDKRDHEYVFYEEKYHGKKRKSIGGGKYTLVDFDAQGADYKIVDFKKCRAQGAVNIAGSAYTEHYPPYNGVIKYKDKYYVYDLSVAGFYSLNLEGYNTKRKRMMPVCSYGKAG